MAKLDSDRSRDLTNAVNAGAAGYQTATQAAGVLTINLRNGRFVKTTLTANVTTLTINLPKGATAVEWFLEVTQDATGSRTLAEPTGGTTPSGTTITPTAAAAAVDTLVYKTFDGGTTWRITRDGANFS